VVLHRAVTGTTERFLAVLIEHFAGAFPVWLSPVQAMVIPIADRHHEYARKVLGELKANGMRAEINESSERMQAKIRGAQLQKIPYMLVAIRLRSGEDLKAKPLAEFIALARDVIDRKE
jgi:threonyl-tRNA synthetase